MKGQIRIATSVYVLVAVIRKRLNIERRLDTIPPPSETNDRYYGLDGISRQTGGE